MPALRVQIPQVPFWGVSASGWPIWLGLSIFSDVNKGETYLIYHDAKYMRKYGDLDMLPQELTPFGDAFLTDQLVGLQPHQYVTI